MKSLFGYFDPVKFFIDMKINTFQGDLPDIWARRKPPGLARMSLCARKRDTCTATSAVRNRHRFATKDAVVLIASVRYARMNLFTTLPHPHGHWQLQDVLGIRGPSVNYSSVL